MNPLLSTAYWPNLHYLYYVLNSDTVFIEQLDHYQKQSFRNRTNILSANGILNLTIPIKQTQTKMLGKEVEISFKENWQAKHWRAITSAYQNSPYFEYFEHEIRTLYDQRIDNLQLYNYQQLRCILKLLKLEKNLVFTQEYEAYPATKLNLRESIHPKKYFEEDKSMASILRKPYYQTFSEKFEFVPNLSCLDLIFNLGLESIVYLKK